MAWLTPSNPAEVLYGRNDSWNPERNRVGNVASIPFGELHWWVYRNEGTLNLV